jgi:hypothetical protein
MELVIDAVVAGMAHMNVLYGCGDWSDNVTTRTNMCTKMWFAGGFFFRSKDWREQVARSLGKKPRAKQRKQQKRSDHGMVLMFIIWMDWIVGLALEAWTTGVCCCGSKKNTTDRVVRWWRNVTTGRSTNNANFRAMLKLWVNKKC